MAQNTIDEYIKNVRNNITKYMKLIFEKKYDKEIFIEYLDSYINARYYNYIEDYKETQYSQKIMTYIRKKRNELINKGKNRELVMNICSFYYYILYFDYILPCKNLEEVVRQVDELRKDKLGIEENDFKKNLKKEVELDWKKNEKFLQKYISDDFTLKIEKFSHIYNLYKVYMEYDIKFPELYDKDIIKNIYNTDAEMLEDKLLVEYNLAELLVLLDIIKKNFKKKYVLEFEPSIISKKQKLARLLKTIDNDISKEKLNIQIRYSDYIKYKTDIFDLIKKGFNVILVIKEDVEISEDEIKKMELFNYLILDKELKIERKIRKNNKLKDKIIYE